jgi:hypothetical protein
MDRPIALRLCLLGCVLVPSAILLSTGNRAEAQPPGWRYETSWRCRKCGGYLGNGVAPPTYCHHCESKRASSGSKGSKGAPTEAIAIAAFAVVIVGGVALYWITTSGSGNNPAGRSGLP